MSRWRLTYQIVKFFLRHLKTKSAAIIPSTAQADIWSLAREGWEEIIEAMAIRVVRLGSARNSQEGLRIGTVRRPPRGVRKTEYTQTQLLRRVAAGAGAERAAGVIRAF